MLSRKHILLIFLAIALASTASGLALLSTRITISNVGTVKAIGVGIYWDIGCSNRVTSVDWGMAEPGITKNVTFYIRNEGNTPITLSINTTNWNPPNASNFITLQWDYDDQPIQPNQTLQIQLMLAISPDIEGITSYGFDIILNAS